MIGLGAHARFPESHPIAVRLPESFRGGCSFGAGATLRRAELSRNGQMASCNVEWKISHAPHRRSTEAEI